MVDSTVLLSCATIYIMNLFNLFCTLHAVNQGVPELNPLMQSIPMMIFYKVIIVGGFLMWLSARPERFAKWGLCFCTGIYATLVLWHIYGLFLMESW